MSKSVSEVIKVSNWNPSAIKYGPPKIGAKNAVSIPVISKDTNRWLTIQTPSMMTWGISDYCDEKGDSNGRFQMSICFPNAGTETAETTEFLEKLKKFQDAVLTHAYENRELWFGTEEMGQDIIKFNFKPFIKYPKNKETKKPDMTKPTIRPKVSLYEGRWDIELYDTNYKIIYPCEDESLSPVDFVPMFSNVVACLQCTGIWIIDGKWGITFKVKQAIVKRSDHYVHSVGKCMIELSGDDQQAIESHQVPDDVEPVEPPTFDEEKTAPAKKEASVTDTFVGDSDNEEEIAPVEKKVVKKIVKKSSPAETTEESTPPPAPAKKIVKKVVAK